MIYDNSIYMQRAYIRAARTTQRMDYGQAVSADGACTNSAEEFLLDQLFGAPAAWHSNLKPGRRCQFRVGEFRREERSMRTTKKDAIAIPTKLRNKP